MGCKPSKEKPSSGARNKRLSRSLTAPAHHSATGAQVAKVLYRLTAPLDEQSDSYMKVLDLPDKEQKQEQTRERMCTRCKSTISDDNEDEGLPLLLEKDEQGSNKCGWNQKRWFNMSAGVSCKVKKIVIAGVPLLYANPMIFGKMIKQNVRLPDGYHTQEEFDEFMSKYSGLLPYWSLDEEGWSIVMDKKMVEEARDADRFCVESANLTPWPLATADHFVASHPRGGRPPRAETPVFAGPRQPEELCGPNNSEDKSSTMNSDSSQSESVVPISSDEGILSTPPPRQRSASDRFDAQSAGRFRALVPPGGDKTVVFYLTTLQGIRLTYEQCKDVKQILDGLHIFVDERDISMDAEFRQQLKNMLGKVLIPSLFIRGMYIGGFDEIMELNETGKLKELVEYMPKRKVGKCRACGDERFIPCFLCNGSRKLFGSGKKFIRCEDCNENGLLRCPICCRNA